MKSIMPWFCLVAVANPALASTNEGIDAYRLGDYQEAAQLLTKGKPNDPIIDYYLGRMRLYGYGQLKNDILAVRHFKQAAEKGFLPAQQMMGRYNLLVAKNPEDALVWFKKAADANDVSAQMYCAAAYLFGLGTPKNPDTAKRYYILAAKNGNSIAQAALAESFLETRQSSNKQLGLIWLNKAIEQKNPEAQILLGRLYARGELFPKDLAKAKETIGLAVAQGYLPALYEMGTLALGENQWQEAKDWFVKAATAHYSAAEIALSDLYANEKNPFHDQHTAFLWMLKSAQNGSVDAQRALADMYKTGFGVEADENLAAEWKQKVTALTKNTWLLSSKKAISWLSQDKASTFAETPYRLQGIWGTWQNPSVLKENNYNQPPQMEILAREALYKPQFVMVNPNKIPISEYYDALVASLGALQHDKLIFPQYPLNKNVNTAEKSVEKPAVNEKEGFDYLQHFSVNADKPAEYQSEFKRLEGQAILGDSTAQFDVGQMYEHGLGVAKDIAAAAKYYRLAAAQQDLRAQYNLAILYLKGEGIAQNYKDGLDLLRDAAFKGSSYAEYVIARINEQGYKDASGNEVIKPDHEQAISMYNLAAANNYGPAQYRLAEILVREKQTDLTQVEKQQRTRLVKELYQGAVNQGVEAATLPLAFYNAMDTQPAKQAQAFAAAKTAADKGDVNAALLLGLLYDRGISVPASQSDALKWYKKAALNPVSAFVLGTYFSQGMGVSQDETKGRSLLQQAAQAQFAYAHLNLAVLQHQKKEAFLPSLDKAFELGNSTAGLLLADYYLSRANDDKQMKQAHDIYQYLADRGDSDGQLKLGYLYEHGLGGAVDPASAEKWYSLSAHQGQPLAQYSLGRLYQLGFLDNKPDYVEAKKWYGEALAKYPPAAVARGFIYDTVDDNYQEALADYQRAALLGDPVGQFNLALIYEKGKGGAIDFAKAQQLYLQAAAKNHRQAMVQLGGLYLNGLVGARDEQQALDWYTKAAKLGDQDALYQLGLLSETGVAVKLDYPQAVKYYQQAADKGQAKATLALARMYQYGLGVPKNTQQAAKLYQQLSAMDNPYAQYQLARFYYDGSAGERLPQRGKELLLQAEENGSQEARQVIQKLDAKTEDKVSFIEPATLVPTATTAAKDPVDMMYLEALSAWNRGDEASSKAILLGLLKQYPNYEPAKRTFDELNQPTNVGAL